MKEVNFKSHKQTVRIIGIIESSLHTHTHTAFMRLLLPFCTSLLLFHCRGKPGVEDMTFQTVNVYSERMLISTSIHNSGPVLFIT